ncbi:MAG: type II toxin-antitoxin system HicA family toxin [Parcubacteria group bacterium]|nr:type II toxin-antitoxin system HicA family toxin [Parcubacteria group bacterium]
MKPLSAKKIEKILFRHGFYLVRQKGSHKIYQSKFPRLTVIVPFHGGNKPIPVGTFLRIVEQSNVPEEEFK